MEPPSSSNTGIDLPVALRRGKRRNSALYSPQKARPAAEADADQQSQYVTVTPSRRRKRVRFSDSSVPSNTNPLSTGITPHLRRSSLGTPRQSRVQTPSRRTVSNDLQFTPLRQILDDRSKRRIARNGLSQEMNDYEADKRAKVTLQKQIEAKDTELKQLKAELDTARTRILESSTASAATSMSQHRVDEVEAELEALRQSFALENSEPVQSWDYIPTGARGPTSEGGDTIRIHEDDDVNTMENNTTDADSLAMGLELEAARQAKQSFLGSFRDTPSSNETNIIFADSPARRQSKAVGPSPRTPRTFYHDLSKQLKATTNRAEEVELAMKSLEHEILGLGFCAEPVSGLEAVTAIADHFRQARLDLERVLPGETAIAFENAKVLPELIAKLKTLLQHLGTKETDLKAARDQHHNLKGNFEKAIVAAEKATAQVKDLENTIEKNAEDMLALRMRANSLEKDLASKEKDVESLVASLNKYRSDVSRLENLISNLEADHISAMSVRVQKISDLDAQVAAETRGRRAAESSAILRLSKITELEFALSQARTHASSVESSLAKLQSSVQTSTTQHIEEVGALNTRISNLSTALASANAEVEKLKITKTKLEERVRMEVEQGARAVETIQMDLIRSVAKTNENKKSYIRGAKVRVANWDLYEGSDDLMSDPLTPGPLTPASMVKFAEFSEEISLGSGSEREERPEEILDTDMNDDHVPGSVEIGRGRFRSRSRSRERSLTLPLLKMKPKRRYDSGIGMSDDSTLDVDADAEDSLLTPELSSEAEELLGEGTRTDAEMMV